MTFKRRCHMSGIGQNLVDGSGALRVAGEVLDSCFTFQKIQSADKKQVFEWSNAAAVRSVSFSSKPISWIDHCHWFRVKLKDPNCYFFKILRFGCPIGQVRFDRFGKSARISVTLDEKYRGKGFGCSSIRLATEHIFKVAPDVHKVDAFVKKDNVASRKAFLKAGFRPAGVKKIHDQAAYHFIRGQSDATA